MKPDNKSGICWTCHEQVCSDCGQCKYCEPHLAGCKYAPVPVGSQKRAATS